MIKPLTFKKNKSDHHTIGGLTIQDIVHDHGTPLYILDQATILHNCASYLDNLNNFYPQSKVLYACKANITIGLVQLLNKQGMHFDVSSGGELYTAIKAGVSPNKIYFHGNNKTISELTLAIHHNVNIIIDNAQELHNIIFLLDGMESPPKLNIMVRLKPEIEAHTHEYIKTGQLDSKFGIEKQDVYVIIKKIINHSSLHFLGIHSHIGSQIFDTKPYHELIKLLTDLAVKLKVEDIIIEELNIGGGIGIAYVKTDEPTNMKNYIKMVSETLTTQFTNQQLPLPTLLFEPGRSIIGNAGITVYTIGAIKHIPNVKSYIFVDGGMADNSRPMMYNSEHVFDLGKVKDTAHVTYSIAGKFCESGDILAHDIELPKCEPDELLIVFGTGAYNYSMASNYNRNCRPAMVMVADGTIQTLVKRETYDDLIRLDCPLKG